MRTVKQILIMFLMFLLMPGVVWAQAKFAHEGPTLGRRVRNLGMGNVGVAIQGSADSSPFYNPAGLNDLEEARYQFLTITGDLSTNSIGLIGDLTDVADGVDAAETDAEAISVLDSFIQSHSGDFQYLRFALDLFNYSRKNMAAGLIIDERLHASFRDQSFPHFDVKNHGDVALYVAGAYDFWEQLLQVGITLRPTVRFSLDESDQQVTFADAVAEGDESLSEQFANLKERRFGLGIDVGLKSNLPIPALKKLPIYDLLKPSVGFAWQDIGNPSFGTASANEQSMSVGAAIHPDIWRLKNVFAIDFRDLNQDRAFLSKLHVGAETQFDLPWKFSVAGRLGLAQGYFTAGATFDLHFVRLDGAFYQEEVSQTVSENGDKRFAVTLSFNI